MGSLAIWAIGADEEAISKQDVVLMVLWVMKMPFQAVEMGPHSVAPGSGAALQALISESQADVAQEAETADDGGIGDRWGAGSSRVKLHMGAVSEGLMR